LAEKIKKRVREESIVKELMIEGFIGLSTGENPRRLREKLDGFVRRPASIATETGAL